MCDEFTAAAEAAALKAKGVTRREFAAMGAAAALAACSGATEAPARQLTGTTVRIQTRDGLADAFFVHPPQGTHPGIIMWPDIGGLRDSFKAMGRSLAAEGFAVLVVNHYYRSAPAPVMTSFSEWRTVAGQAKIAPTIAAITPEGTMHDAAAFAAFLDGQQAVDKSRRIGANGYCFGGPMAIRTAAAVPGRVGAAASMHGAQLVTAAPDSPHRLLARTQASFFFAIGRNDDSRAPGDKEFLRQAAASAHRPAEIAVFPADHGWCVPDTPMYDRMQADRAKERMLELFAVL